MEDKALEIPVNSTDPPKDTNITNSTAYINYSNIKPLAIHHIAEFQESFDDFLSNIPKTDMIFWIFFTWFMFRLFKWILKSLAETNLTTLVIKIGTRLPILKYFLKKELEKQWGILYTELGKVFHNEPKTAEVVPHKRIPSSDLQEKWLK